MNCGIRRLQCAVVAMWVICDVAVLASMGSLDADLGSLRGTQFTDGQKVNVPGCEKCTMKSKDDIYECKHSATGPCDKRKCIHSYVQWFNCDKKIELNLNKCALKYDAAVVVRTQRIYQVDQDFSCPETEKYKVIPGAEAHDCNYWGWADPDKQGAKGKCFLTGEEITRCKAGTIVEDWFFQGTLICDPAP